MGAVDYSLLTLKGGTLSGPLAELAETEYGGQLSKWPVRLLARMRPKGLTLLGLRMEEGGGERCFSPTGVLARTLGEALAQQINQALKNKGRPLLERNGQSVYTLYQPPVPSAPLMRVLASRLVLKRTGRPRPATHTMQITSACQCDCLHCSAARHRRPGEPELTTQELKGLIRQTLALGVVNISFTGGEPLLRKDLCELIAAVDPNEAIASMFTNGLLLSEEMIARLQEAGLFSVMVSLDSPDAEEHDQLRRCPGAWKRATEGIARCVKAGLLCGLSTYATPKRLHGGQVMEMIELARRLGAPEITIFDVVPTGRLLHEEESELLTAEDQTELCALEEEINGRSGYPHVITQAHVNGPTGAGLLRGLAPVVLDGLRRGDAL